MQSVADKVVERQGVVGPATYPPWQGEAVRFVRQARAVDRTTKAARAAAWVVIPPDRLRAHEPDLVKRGFHVLGQVLRVDHLTASERVELANYLDLTERQKTEYMLAGFASPDLEAREDALLATCPRYTSTGFELDLPDGLKRTHQGRAALLEAGAKIKAYLQRDCPGWRLEWAWSSSCPHRDQGTRCPEGGRCPEGVSGLHGSFGVATDEAAHPQLLRVTYHYVQAVAAEVGVPTSENVPPGHRGAFVDLATLRPKAASRGSVYRPLGAQHPKAGPKRLCRELYDGPATPLKRRDLLHGYLMVEEEATREAELQRRLKDKPKKPPPLGVVTRLARAAEHYPRTLQVLQDHRPADPHVRRHYSLALAAELLRAGLDRETVTDLIFAGLRRTERRSAERDVVTTAQRLQFNQAVRSRASLLNEGHSLVLVRLAAALSLDMRKPLWPIMQSMAKRFQRAGETKAQHRAEALLSVLGSQHRYAKALQNCMLCGITYLRDCTVHGVQDPRHVTCKTPWCDYCKLYQQAGVAHKAAALWSALRAPMGGPRHFAAATTQLFSSVEEAHRWRRRNVSMQHRWVLGTKGRGKWYFLLLVSGPSQIHGAVPDMLGGVEGYPRLSPEQAADLALATLASVQALSYDLFLTNSHGWVELMDQIYGRHLTGGQRGCLPWPKRGQQLEAGADEGEGEHDCAYECAAMGFVTHRAVCPQSGQVIGEWRGFAPSQGTLVARAQALGFLTPTQRLKQARDKERPPPRGPT